MFSNDRPFFAGIRTIVQKMYSCSSKKLAPYGFNRFEMMVLLMVYEDDGISQKRIVSEAGGEGISIGIAVKSLSNKGYIERKTDQDDRRKLRLYVTDSGRKIRDEIMDLKRTVEESIVRGISSEELCLLDEIMQKIQNKILLNDFEG
ncbi:MAG: MarR family winged helix-turn-helix transcriptional regulator [Spirochaetales bacterium]|nr:MarR family winged helix-turn-helix transcriptional regulator [Spirochaetales bacterium]